VGGHSVALSVNLAPPVYDPLYLAADPAIRSLRIYLDVGQDDWTRPSMDDLHNKLNASEVAHDYYVYEGSHADAYWAAHLQEYLLFYTAGW
jgi:enterochelin esterase-like enzyme